MRPGGNFGPPYIPEEDQRIEAYGDSERRPDWSNFVTVFNASARAGGRPERKPYGLEQRYRAIKRRQTHPVVPPKRGRPNKVKSQPTAERPPQAAPKSATRRQLTEAHEAAVVKLAGECVEVRRRINVHLLLSKLVAQFPELRGRVGYNLLRGALRRHGAIEAVARGERPEMSGKVPEDLLDRIKAERCRIANELRVIDEERERLSLKGQYLLRRYDLLQDYERGLEKLEAPAEAASALAGAPSTDPGPDAPRHPDDAGFGYREPGGHS